METFCSEVHKWEEMNDTFRHGSGQSQLQLLWGCFRNCAKKKLAENAYKSYHVYKVIVVLHIYKKVWASD